MAHSKDDEISRDTRPRRESIKLFSVYLADFVHRNFQLAGERRNGSSVVLLKA